MAMYWFYISIYCVVHLTHIIKDYYTTTRSFEYVMYEGINEQ